jgi:hypothetical protein
MKTVRIFGSYINFFESPSFIPMIPFSNPGMPAPLPDGKFKGFPIHRGIKCRTICE